MKRLIFYFLILLFAVWGGLKIAADPGYLLISYQKNTIEMPVWFACFGIVLGFIVFYFLLRLISNMFSLTARIRAWNRQRRVRRAWQRTHRGFIALAAGEFALAESDLLRAVKYTDTPILNYLAAARAAQGQNKIAQRDEYLSKINEKGRLPELAVGLTQAKLQLEQQQYEQALATLQQLQHIAPKHKPLLVLLKQTYYHLHDWASLEILFPQLEKYQIFNEEKLQKLQIKIYTGLLTTASKQKGDSIELVWQRTPKELRLNPEVLDLYLPYISKKDHDEAEKIIRHSLSHAESLLKEKPNDANLLLTLGELCVKSQLWGKARSYFDASLIVAPKAKTYFELAKLLEQLGETDKAMETYRRGLALSIQ
ncbi:MAG TPA: heme biosynthesis HemY N-terminal domain-containing protein [Gammaproteobacteria bacterium]|nr:heme biosynthesis HemY N-terminal domain-containing protein [Gammaproteobacteria bacterium]